MTGIDVFVVSHDHESTLAATMAGLAAQTLRPDRVVLVDNASTDGSLAAARAGAGALPLDVVANTENRGFAAAANQALRATAGGWVLALNPDCRLEPEFLARLVAAVGERPRVGAATGLLLRAAGPRLDAGAVVDSAGIVVTASGRHLDRAAGEPPGAVLLSPAWVFGATGAAALYRRAALDDVAYPGGEVFDEGFFSYREDADLAWRLQRRGWRCLYWPEARAAHGRGLKPEARRRGSPAVNRHSVRNRFLLRMANADWRWHLACFPLWLLRDLAVVAACLTVERTSLPGLAEAWRLRRRQCARGRANAERAVVSGWAMARWFVPGRRVEKVT
jgi:GT2 family glycosyltransferase